MAKTRKQLFGKYHINLYRKGEIRFDNASYPVDAARKATKWARKGWEAKVMKSTGPKTLMTCKPTTKKRGAGEYASCVIAPAFKKRIKGL